MSSIQSIPIEVILDNLLMEMPIQSVVRLGSTNRYFAGICSDELLWKRRLVEDFNFSGADTARVSGWKFIYKGLFNPRVFVWGQNTNGRLGLARFPKGLTGVGVPFPVQLRIPSVRVVKIVSGGMSFTALDSEGNVHVWGTLDATTSTLTSEGFSKPGKTAPQPLRLQLPSRIKEISCGRLHSSALDRRGRVWTFTSWGRPWTLSTPHLLRDSRPIQVECGWAFSSVLTKAGEVFVWWPHSGRIQEQIESHDRAEDEAHRSEARASDGVISCAVWDVKADPYRLPPLPRLPDLVATGEENEEEIKIIKIAGLDSHIVALTNQGHVLLFRALENEDSVQTGRWHYLPNFSELDRIRALPPFTSTDEGTPAIDPPQTMKITHISGHFQKFFAYSTGASSVVLGGDVQTTEDSEPSIDPALQHKSIIAVHVGDWHNAALTSSGKLLTWGGYSAGALGLGNPTDLTAGTPGAFSTERQRLDALERGFANALPNTETPAEVRFDHARKTPKDRFCFSACASGWQTGALVIDLEPDAEESEEEELEEGEEEEAPRQRRFHRSLPIQTPHQPALPVGGGIFRVGFAGRGATRGRGM
ncbi:regulator of chromosome condensation 1/beta-lactamase-inhibitor protein II [Roridomyces roridus]|uniref:Regulator of chromosome condensation 1/beta-lactamase-inhibitor protein II n=1 Tax=Roridomyces roridus TaxID=1738132 RepID=A0AAD7BJF3_9AGAR|nr:regulator of chromosome condensation 1/beta-lactamase-inhibitor protein II [Roridomyces roridus]